jgi:hypothetical protein
MGMVKQMYKIYEAINHGTDGMDSYGIGYFTKKADAEKAAEGKGAMGYGNGSVNEDVVYESYKDYVENNPVSLKQKALAKLTQEEKEVLGLERRNK